MAEAQTVQTFSASGTWVCPAGVTSIKIETWGAGGGGGYAISTNRAAGGGGGGGAYTYSNSITVVPGTTYYYIVGTGGTAGTAAGVAATAGQSSCFSTLTNCGGTILTSANGGGAGGSVAANTSGTAGTAGSGGTFVTGSFTGGTGSVGLNGNAGTDGGGGGGGGASTTANGGSSTSSRTGGTSIDGGAGGSGANSATGGTGNLTGGGGAGGHRISGTDRAGGAGANGQVRITYTLPPCVAANIPYTQDFESVTVPAIPTCNSIQNAGTGNNWITANNPGYGFTSNTLKYTYHSTNAADAWFYTQGLNLTSGVSYRLTYQYGSTGATFPENLKVAYGTTATSGSMTTTLATHNSITTTNNSNTIDFIPGTTGVYYIGFNAFSIANKFYLFVDDINVTLSPTCFPPTLTATTSITTTTATINWNAASPVPGSGYEYVVSTSNSTPAGAGTSAAGLSANISGLTANTTYYIFVRSNCGSGDFSAWTPSGSFTTLQAPCVAPGSQASTFALGTITSTALPATFTGTANGYLVIRSLTNTPPSQPVNATTYSAANIATLGAGLTFVQSSSATTITGTGLGGNTQYYYFIYAYNNTGCLGGPIYNASGPLTGNGITCPEVPNSVTNTTTVNSFALNWATPTGGSASPITYTIQVTTDAGYTANIAGSPFTVSDPTTTLNISGLTTNTTYYYRIRANNAICSSTYVTGNTFTGYCVSTSTSSTYYIKDFSTTGGTANITNNTSGYSATGYGNFTAQAVSQQPYGSVNFSTAFFDGFNTYGFNIWIDWNDDMDFNDTGEKVYASGAYVASATGTITVPGTTTVGNHRMRIRANYSSTDPSACASITNGETEDYTFTVLASACPGIPTAVVLSSITMTSGTVSWTASSPAPANGYQYYITTSATLPNAGTTPTGSTAAGVTTVNVTGLTANTTYYVYVRNNCGSGNFSPWTTQVILLTGYCISTSTSSTYYINNFSTTGGTANITNNGSGYSATGYGNFTAMSVSQQQFGTVSFSETFSTTGYGLNIWVDWNDDLDFDDAGEKVYTTGAYIYTNPATGSFVVPGTASVGNHRMRIRANYNSSDPNGCGSITSGETEDYTFTVIASACPGIPTNVTLSAITQTSATINWTASAPAPASGYQYYITTSATLPTSGTTPTGSTAAGITTVNITGLTADTTYYIYVRNNCGAGNYSPWTIQIQLTTGYCASSSSSSSYYINNFSTTGGTANITNNGSGYSAGGYGNFTAQSVSQINFGSVSFSSTITGGSAGYNIWVDWNNDFDFDDTGELVYASGAYVNSATGSFVVPGTASVGNHRMRMRSNYSAINPNECGSISNGETEDYTFNVLPPLPCSGNATGITATVVSQTTATINWTEASPVPANGYQYYLSASNTTPGAGATPTGSTGFGVTTINLTGLSPATTYYIWIRSNCGGGLGQGVWVGPTAFYQPNCTVGNSTGTTTLACPSVLSGGLGLNGANPAAIMCTSSNCVDLEATYLPLGQTTSYTVESIPYAPPYQFGCLQNPVSVNKDDVWSPIINLPFNFCFYGNTYNSCLIGSNGILSFNTANAGGATGYSFSNNLPSTTGALFANTIYGVYHDIDPSAGGEVGWELITLNTGCRALVASWSNVPMFSNNTILYTGMMVLYENTNVIEVYIKDKRIDGTWNGGNAIVGIQNSAGTQAVTAPLRNGLDADWTATNEAWRFVPSGASITSLKWYQGSGTSGPIVGTTDVLNVCPTATTTYTAEVTYTLCNGITLIETEETTVTVSGNKTWNGSVDTDWNTANNWTPPGVPTPLDCVVIPNVTTDPIVSGVAYNAEAYTLTIQNGGILTINTNNSITVTNFVSVNTGGTFNIQDSASLIQIDNVVNLGDISMTRITEPMYRYDYTYWSTPVTLASNFTLGNLSPATTAFYTWTPSVAGGSGNWASATTTTAMNPNKGYIVRAPNTFSTNPAIKVPYTGTFTGVANNGDITAPILFGSMGAAATNDKWNLIGNPYPSAIAAADFLNLASNVPLIDGTIYFWTHNTPPSSSILDPFYGDFVINYTANDYASWNVLGGVGTAASSTFGAGVIPDGYITAGTAFFVKSLNAPGSVTFQNTMRVPHNNAQFYRSANPTTVNESGNFEKHRLWLNLTNNSGAFSQILVGYAEGATYGMDRSFDGTRFGGNGVTLYSILPEAHLGIQGRPLPFDVFDKVALGYNAAAAGTYSVRIDHFDGLFENQTIFLEDLLLNITHNLKQAPYTYITEAGNFNNRFVLRYKENTLGQEDFNLNNSVQVATNQKVTVYSTRENIKNIIVYDILGRKIEEYNNLKATEFTLENLKSNNVTLLVEITLENEITVIQKIIY